MNVKFACLSTGSENVKALARGNLYDNVVKVRGTNPIPTDSRSHRVEAEGGEYIAKARQSIASSSRPM